jgi:uncharacterized protein YPO0396
MLHLNGELTQRQLPLSNADAQCAQTTFRLVQLEVFNWGPFNGLHRAEFDRGGTAIIGPTGSGKTTLVDALMTLLVSQPRYNLASTGGHESDRTLISYVRGVLGGDGADGREEVARPGKTITGIAATYQGSREVLRLGCLLWIDGTSNAQNDLKRRWFFSQADDQTLEVWIRQLHGDGVRELMRSGREIAKLRIFDSKRAYLTHIRKFFDVGENAFTLLNRAAGLKQLNSVDEIFRDLVLDDRSAFDRAIEVAGDFDNLAEIHGELERAKRQIESLTPVADEYATLARVKQKKAQWYDLKRILPKWFAIISARKWAEVREQCSLRINEAQSRRRQLKEEEKTQQSLVDTLREQYLALGGNVIGELQKTIDAQRELVKEKARHASDYQRMVSVFKLENALSDDALKRNQAKLRGSQQKCQDLHNETQNQMLGALARHREQEIRQQDMQAALRKVKERPGSNIPPHFQDFRAELATHLGLSESDLPFLAELIEVHADHSDWRGAIERAVGSDRLRILVPEASLAEGLRWVNNRNNQLHVRLQRAGKDGAPASYFPDSFVHKLNFKPHRLQSTARSLLAGRDLHCVSSPDELKATEHGLTIQGMISGKRGKFEKQDQRRLDQDWMTGFDNKDQLLALERHLHELGAVVRQLDAEAKKLNHKHKAVSQRLTMIENVLALDYSLIDLPGAEAEVQRSQQRLAALLDPQSDASKAKEVFEKESKQLERVMEDSRKVDMDIAAFDRELNRAEGERTKAELRIGDGLTPEENDLAKKRLAVPADTIAADMADAERDARDGIDRKLADIQNKVAESEQRLVRLMEAALRVDAGALADVGSSIEDAPHYLERLRVLNEESLPEKRSRFLEYLNRSSDQGVTQLLAGINEEVDAIEQRIKELNLTLVRVDFRSGRYLQLKPQRITHERLRTLEAAMRKVRSGALKDDEGESHYKALRELVDILRDAGEKRRLIASRALLDPRYRLQFFVIEVDRQTGSQSPPRTGSQSGSGGEKELMASHILTASLSYALSPSGASRPLYGTVVLDEAFSKSSPSAAARIIEALRIFRLHPIFVTPNKEVGLLKLHTRRVICVQRMGKEASLASITWERLEELARSQ